MFFNLIMEKKKFPLGPDAWVEVIHFGYNPESAQKVCVAITLLITAWVTGIEIVEANPKSPSFMMEHPWFSGTTPLRPTKF